MQTHKEFTQVIHTISQTPETVLQLQQGNLCFHLFLILSILDDNNNKAADLERGDKTLTFNRPQQQAKNTTQPHTILQ